MRCFAWARLLAAWAFIWGGLLTGWTQAPGIYADFSTSLGDFTCQLDYQHAPKAVANFIGLATGQRAWVEETSGQVRTSPFYNGITFHRVIAGFIIQAGSRNGFGTDSPGYAFPDEFDPSVRHDAAGVLSSANSGTNSNGAQFFITVEPTPFLNDVHTIFGRVVSGQSVVDAINQVPTGANDKPITPVVLQTVMIRRVGSAAEGFDIDAQNLPVVSYIPMKIGHGPGAGQIGLTFSNRQFAAHRLLASTNFPSWTSAQLGIRLEASQATTLTLSNDSPHRFFEMTEVQYPSSTLSPLSLANRTLTLNFSQGSTTMTIQFNAAGGGSYTFPPLNPGSVILYQWIQQPYRGYLSPIFFSGVVQMSLRLDFRGELNGVFSGTAYTSPPSSVSGNFLLSAP